MRLLQIALCSVLLVSAALSQTKRGDMVVDVPFEFAVAGQLLPAGHYIVAAEADNYVRIFAPQTTGVYVPTHGASRPASDGSKLVFHRYGDSYFLSAIWVTGDTAGRELFRSRAERSMADRKSEMQLAVVRPAK
jgi:hypothetical protein